MTGRLLRVTDLGGNEVEMTILHGDEWSALYLNGQYVDAGDTHNVWSKLAELLGVDEESIEPDHLLFPDYRQTGTLAEVRERIVAHEARLQEAARIEQQAEELRQRAHDLREQR